MILAVETATRATSVALLRGDDVIAELTTVDDRVHSERLLPAIDAVLAQASAGLDDVDGFAVSIGPGSFTGLRIGLATVKGLAFGSDRPVAAVPTLLGLAEAAAGAPGPVVPLLDAHRGEVFVAIYPEPGLDRVTRPETLASEVPPGATLVVGEGAEAAARLLSERLGGRLEKPVPGPALAAHVGRIGQRMLARGEGIAPEALLPRYVRRAEAEVRRTGQRFESR